MTQETEFLRQLRARRRRRGKTLLILAAVCGFTWLVHDMGTQNIVKLKAASVVAAMSPASFDEPTPSASEAPLVEYPVIVGGVHSLNDLKAALARYPNLYAGFDIKTAGLTVLSHDVIARSSYRVVDEIRWTRKAIVIRAGTEVWMDALGNVIESRCGNALWTIREVIPPEVAQDPVPSTLYPPTADIGLIPEPLDASLVPPGLQLPPSTFTPATPSNGFSGPIPVCCGGFISTGGPNTPVNTPEPNTALLTAFGITALFLIRRFA